MMRDLSREDAGVGMTLYIVHLHIPCDVAGMALLRQALFFPKSDTCWLEWCVEKGGK